MSPTRLATATSDPRFAAHSALRSALGDWSSDRWQLPIVFLAFFLAFLAARWEVLTSPPYFDMAIALFREADFLVATGFDYVRLRYHEPWAQEGGAYVYMISLLPTLLALVMRFSPTVTASLLVWHLVSFAAGSVLLTALFALLRPLAGGWIAMLAAIAVGTTPLVLVQVDIMGMDIPMTACAVVAACCIIRERFALGAAAALLAFLMKANGVFVTVVTLGYLVLAIAAARAWSPPRSAAVYWRALALYVALFVCEITIYRLGGLGSRLRDLDYFGNYAQNFGLLCPDLLVVASAALLLAGLLGVGWLIEGLRRTRGSPPMLRCRELFSQAVATRPLVWYALLIVVTAVFMNWVYARVFVLRYFTVAVAFLYAFAATAILSDPRRRTWGAAALVGVVAFNLANVRGRFFPTVPGADRHCGVLERSLEYLDDHRSNVTALRMLGPELRKTPIVAGYPWLYYLALPRLGYVSEPLAGYGTLPLPGSHFRDVREMFADQPPELIFISVKNPTHYLGLITVPGPAAGDEVLYDDGLDPPLVIFRRRTPAVRGESRAFAQWCIEQLWVPGVTARPWLAGIRAHELARWGRSDLAVALVKALLRQGPEDIGLQLLLCEMHVLNGGPQEAATQAIAAERLAEQQKSGSDERAQAAYWLGVAWLLQGKTDEAAMALTRSLELDPRRSQVHYQLGLVHLQRKQPREAIACLTAAIALAPDWAEARNFLGIAYWQQGQRDLAVEQFRAAVAARRGFADAHYNLGVVLKEQGQSELARVQFAEATRLRGTAQQGGTTEARVAAPPGGL